MTDVPVIDLTPCYTGTAADKAALARRIDKACSEIGFFTVAGHRVAKPLVDDVFDTAFEFFNLPVEEKRRYLPPPDTVLRGYMAHATNKLAKSRGKETPPDLREGYFIGRPDLTGDEKIDDPDARPFYRPCIWPERPPRFAPVFSAYYAEMSRLAGDLMSLFALGLGLDEGYFDDKIDDHFAALNVFHYPRQSAAPEGGQLRAGAHTDFGSLTILLQMPGTGGLEVMAHDGQWRHLPPREDTFVINIGDMMAWWTNDRWRSTLHRVVNPPGESTARSARVSVGFFCHPNFDARVDPPASCAGGEVRESIKAGEWMRRKIFAVRGIPIPAKPSVPTDAAE
ncbi:MAG: isopenicillin N synthase family dioxygenase [Hyphomicrobiaceae bacterium]